MITLTHTYTHTHTHIHTHAHTHTHTHMSPILVVTLEPEVEEQKMALFSEYLAAEAQEEFEGSFQDFLSAIDKDDLIEVGEGWRSLRTAHEGKFDASCCCEQTGSDVL